MNAYINNSDVLEENSKCIQIKTKTWSRDSHGLFDYENNQVKTATILINSNGSLLRKKHDVLFINNQENNKIDNDNQDILELAKINIINDEFQISNKLETNMPVNNQTLTDLQEKIWHVVKSNSSNQTLVNTNSSYLSHFKYEIKKNDIMKLGRIKFLIKEMNIAEGGEFITTEETFRPYQECEKITTVEGDICRICLFNSTDDDTNPIISVCKCRGSINLIHLNCLKLWLEQKLTTRETTNKPGISYTIKSFNCELCKEPYPTTIKFKDHFYHLLNYFVPEGQNFIILESLNSIKENQYPLSIHVLMFIDDGDSFILGRGHESDVRISDISVSRSHAKITYNNKKFSFEDTGSKFGSLVLAKHPLTINQSNSILQIGRTLLSISEVINENITPNQQIKDQDYEIKFDFNQLNNLGVNVHFPDKFFHNSNEMDNIKFYKENNNDDDGNADSDKDI